LRPLKIVSKNEKMKTVVNALVEAFPPLMNILLLLLMFILVFAIMGLQLLKGALGSCNNDDYETILMK
jgi:voltage-dependent calcium channel T type alpha-1G